MNFRYAIVMTDTDGQEVILSRHKSLERAEKHLAWLGMEHARIVELGGEDDKG